MNNKLGNFTEDAFEKGQQVAKQSLKSVVNAVTSQVKGSNTPQYPADMSSHGQDAQAAHGQDMPSELAQIEKNTHQQTAKQYAAAQKQPMTTDKKAKTPEEQAQMEAVRKKLWVEQHIETYYNPTFNPPKKKDEPVTEKLEREKQEEMMELQQKEAKKPQPMAVQQAQQSTEKFRGASG